MKNKVFIWTTIICAIILSGCKDFLETDLEGQYTSSTYFQTEDHAISAINAVYDIASFSSTNNNLWVFGDVASDDAVKGGNDGDQSEIGSVNNFMVNADNGVIENFWKHYYEGITRANNLLYYVPQIEMDDDLKNEILAEAKFLRAYFYFHLTNIYGEIPLKTLPAFSPDDLHVPLFPITEVYAQIETDLEEAIAFLPAGQRNGHASKGSAQGLLAKVYLFQEKWDDALTTIQQFEIDGSYDLLAIYKDNFSLEFENNIESVFEIQHLEGQVPSEGTYLTQWFSPNVNNGYFFNAPTQSFVDEFEITQDAIPDPRLDYTVGRDGQKWVDGQIFSPTWSPSTGYLSKKIVQDIASNLIGDAGLNYTYMRYSEVLLMKAEALNELNNGAEALFPLNRVRKRARESYLFDADLPGFGTIPENLLKDVTTTDQIALRDVIRHERRVELGFEFHRFFDLIRYGQQYAEDALAGTGFNYDQHSFFPIPQSEIDTNSKIN